MGDQAGTQHQSQPNEQKKKLSDKDLDLSNTTRGVWLVKVPNYIADRWKECNSQEEVGKLKITRR